MNDDLKRLMGVGGAIAPGIDAHVATRHGEEIEESDDEALWEEELEQELGISSAQLDAVSQLKQKLYKVLYSTVGEVIIFGMIVASVALLIVELAMPTGATTYHGNWWEAWKSGAGWFFWLDVDFSIFFITEYALKLWIAPRK